MLRNSFCRVAVATASCCLALGISYTANSQDLLVCGWNSHDVDRNGETWIESGSGGLTRPHAMLYNVDDDLLVASVGTNQVLKYNGATGDFIEVFVDSINNGGMSSPTDIRFGPEGDLYVASFNNGRVIRFNGETGDFIEIVVSVGNNDGMTGPEKIRFHNGLMYVLSGQQNRVLEFDHTEGVFIKDYISAAGSGLADPHNFLFGGDGFVYVTSFNNQRVVRFNESDGTFDEILISSGLSQPHGITIGPVDGDLYISNFGSNNVKRFDLETGDFIETVISSGVSSPIAVIFTPKVSSTMLIDFQVVSGVLLDGTVAELETSDDQYVQTRSGFGQTLIDLHNMEIIVNAVTTVDSASTIDLTIESRIDEPAGLAQIRLRNWNTNQFDSVGSYSIGNIDNVDTINSISAVNYVDGGGNIDLSIKHLVFVPFLAFTFVSFIDQIEIVVN